MRKKAKERTGLNLVASIYVGCPLQGCVCVCQGHTCVYRMEKPPLKPDQCVAMIPCRLGVEFFNP